LPFSFYEEYEERVLDPIGMKHTIIGRWTPVLVG
jgi:CubicO group peptidase (beta-lactamase class C family)